MRMHACRALSAGDADSGLERCRYDGWVTEMRDEKARHQMGKAAGLDNLLYSGDAGEPRQHLVPSHQLLLLGMLCPLDGRTGSCRPSVSTLAWIF